MRGIGCRYGGAEIAGLHSITGNDGLDSGGRVSGATPEKHAENGQGHKNKSRADFH